MTEEKAPWQRTFEAFAGHGIHRPSDMMRVTESEARTILAGLGTVNWRAPAYEGVGRHAGYTVCNATEAWTTVIFHAGVIVGFYAGSCLWIAKEQRSHGLSTPLILVAAGQRGGTILPPGVVIQGYTPVGVAAHRSAHCHAVLTALAKGRVVPAAVLEEMQQHDYRLPPPALPFTCLP